jgi:hypothetical protein
VRYQKPEYIELIGIEPDWLKPNQASLFRTIAPKKIGDLWRILQISV